MSPAKFKLWAVDDKHFIVDINVVNYDIEPLTKKYF